MLFPTSSPLLTKQGVEVQSIGELVNLRIGNVDLKMGYEHALDISRWIREEARAAKRAVGRGRSVRSLGSMDNSQVFTPRQPGVAIHVKEKLQAWRRSDVATEGRLVRVRIGNTDIRFHFETALKISQWLRVRAKESKRRAGNEAHWSVLGSLDEL